MRVKVFAIEDLKSGFGNPFVAVNEQIAKRDFVRLVRDPDSMLFHNPEDFRLMHIGSFDAETGELHGLSAPAHILDAKGVSIDG